MESSYDQGFHSGLVSLVMPSLDNDMNVYTVVVNGSYQVSTNT